MRTEVAADVLRSALPDRGRTPPSRILASSTNAVADRHRSQPSSTRPGVGARRDARSDSWPNVVFPHGILLSRTTTRAHPLARRVGGITWSDECARNAPCASHPICAVVDRCRRLGTRLSKLWRWGGTANLRVGSQRPHARESACRLAADTRVRSGRLRSNIVEDASASRLVTDRRFLLQCTGKHVSQPPAFLALSRRS